MPNDRHRIQRVKQRTPAHGSVNSVVEPWVDIKADIDAINRGDAVRQGEDYVVNGRRYRVKPDGKAFPVDGDGIHPLRREAYKALGIYNAFGIGERAEQILDKRETSPADRDAARRAWNAGQKGR